MRFSRAFHRPWVYVIVPARVIAGWFTIVSLQSLAVLPVETRAERRGEFVIAYHTYDAFGHRGTRRTLYYMDGRRRRLIHKNVVDSRSIRSN